MILGLRPGTFCIVIEEDKVGFGPHPITGLLQGHLGECLAKGGHIFPLFYTFSGTEIEDNDEICSQPSNPIKLSPGEILLDLKQRNTSLPKQIRGHISSMQAFQIKELQAGLFLFLHCKQSRCFKGKAAVTPAHLASEKCLQSLCIALTTVIRINHYMTKAMCKEVFPDISYRNTLRGH